MAREKGSVSIHTENIFPIIKKWLYSDKDIFVRELVSNAADAISKLKKLVDIGEADIDKDTKFVIKVVINKDDKTIRIEDNGIGMTEEEVKKYINQIAFSGAREFFERYKDKTDESQIIGHFGLGFYSAFMVSKKVQIDTLSYMKEAKAVRWISEDGTGYELDDSDRSERGTTVTLYVADDSLEFLDEFTMRNILEKYFAFLPYEIYLEDASKKSGKEDEKEEQSKPVNDTNPLWLKKPKDCTEEEYKEFYKKVFHDFNDPLFWIHLDVEYPFNLKGILYFPKLKHEFDTLEGQIKLYYNQVFVADNIKEIIPEFLLLLKGVLDCPDLPLNVSRSFLQNDGYVKKLSAHITKKVGDKLISLYENERENYNRYWDDIHPFVKYGCMREEKFYDRVKDIVVFKTINGEYVTLKEYLEKNKEKHKDKVYYVSDEKQQAQYVKLFKENNIDAVILPSLIDNHFITFLEMKENSVKFCRVDSDLSDGIKDEASKTDEATEKAQLESMEKLFREMLNNDKLKIKLENLKNTSVSAVLLFSEYSRRIRDMSRMFGGTDAGAMFPEDQTLVLNKSNNLIQSLLKIKDCEDRKEDVKLICLQVYDLALMGHRQLEPEALEKFIERSNQILERLAAV